MAIEPIHPVRPPFPVGPRSPRQPQKEKPGKEKEKPKPQREAIFAHEIFSVPVERHESFEAFSPEELDMHEMRPALPGGHEGKDALRVQSKRRGEWHEPPNNDEQDPKKAHEQNLEGIAASLGNISLFVAILREGLPHEYYMFAIFAMPILAGFSASRIGVADKDPNFFTAFSGFLLNRVSWVAVPTYVALMWEANSPAFVVGAFALSYGGYILGRVLRRYT